MPSLSVSKEAIIKDDTHLLNVVGKKQGFSVDSWRRHNGMDEYWEVDLTVGEELEGHILQVRGYSTNGEIVFSEDTYLQSGWQNIIFQVAGYPYRVEYRLRSP